MSDPANNPRADAPTDKVHDIDTEIARLEAKAAQLQAELDAFALQIAELRALARDAKALVAASALEAASRARAKGQERQG